MATLTISFNGLSRSWNISAGDQTRVLNALKVSYATPANPTPTNSQVFTQATSGFVESLVNVVQSVEGGVASAAAIAAITPVAFTEQ